MLKLSNSISANVRRSKKQLSALQKLGIMFIFDYPQSALIKMKVKPLYDRLIVKRVEEKEVKTGGIIIPDTAKEKPMEGKVVAVGKGRVEKDGTTIPLQVKVGDRILFGKYAGTEIKIEEKEHIILREEEVLGVIQ